LTYFRRPHAAASAARFDAAALVWHVYEYYRPGAFDF